MKEMKEGVKEIGFCPPKKIQLRNEIESFCFVTKGRVIKKKIAFIIEMWQKKAKRKKEKCICKAFLAQLPHYTATDWYLLIASGSISREMGWRTATHLQGEEEHPVSSKHPHTYHREGKKLRKKLIASERANEGVITSFSHVKTDR